jgi:excisionase family DNA binding protein
MDAIGASGTERNRMTTATAHPISNPRVLYPVVEAAYLLGMSRTEMFARIARHEIKAVHIGKLVRVHRDEIERFAARLMEAS